MAALLWSASLTGMRNLTDSGVLSPLWTTDVLGGITPCCDVCPVLCRMFIAALVSTH